MPYETGHDDGGDFIACLNEDCEAYGRHSYSQGDIQNKYCSVCGFHEENYLQTLGVLMKKGITIEEYVHVHCVDATGAVRYNTVSKVAKRAKISIDKAQRILDLLEEHGLVHVGETNKKTGEPTYYSIIEPGQVVPTLKE